MAAPDNPWGDFNTILHDLRSMTVVSLKTVITGFGEESVVNLSKGGRKSDLQERIINALHVLQSGGKVDKWQKARAIILQARSGADYDPSTLSRYMNGQTSNTATAVPSRYPLGNNSSGLSTPYNPLPNRPVLSSPSNRNAALTVPKWRLSPFYNIDQAVSSVHECPESASSTDRRSARFNFYLTQDHISKLQSTTAKFQLRLYCTTSQYFITLGTSFRNTPCPVEFPPTCEVRVNGKVLTANFRGIKKKAGTAPPADITEHVRMGAAGIGNQIEMVYVNSSQPVPNKKPVSQKYYLIVNLVQVTSVDQLVEQLKHRVQPKEHIIAKMKTQRTDDDEVQAGPSKLSLRDPLTYTRLVLPCRAASCVHLGCFDATCWYAMMEQTTTWLCPICDHTLEVDDLIIDGFVADILQNVPDDIEDVMVEADGEWHSENGKYGSLSWMQLHGTARDSVPVVENVKTETAPSPPSTKVSSEGAITIGDSSDSEGEREVKRELSPIDVPLPNLAPPAAPTASGPVVIDLTLSDSDDEQPAPPRRSAPSHIPLPPPSVLGKRKLSSDGEMATGSSRRTSTAASHRSPRGDDDDYSGYQDRSYGSNHYSHHSLSVHNATSPPIPNPLSSSPSPAVYHYQNNNLPSPPRASPTATYNQHHWQPPRSSQSQYTLPPASSLLTAGGSMSPPGSHRPQPPTLPPLNPRHTYDRHPHSSLGGSSSNASRYAEWGIRP